MGKVKLAVIYYSMGGTNYQLAKWAAQGAEEAGAEVRILKVREIVPQSVIDKNPAWKALTQLTKDIPEATTEDLDWADGIIFSTPTRYGVMASQMKQFIDSTGAFWAQGKTVNKVVSAMASAQNPHGGQEATILSLYTVMYHWGAIVAAPGFTDKSVFKAGGNPYGTSVTVNQEGKMTEDVQASVIHQAKRTVLITGWIKSAQK